MKENFNLQLLRPARDGDETVLRIRKDGSLSIEIDRKGRGSRTKAVTADLAASSYRELIDSDTRVTGDGGSARHTLSVAVRLFRLQGLLPSTISQ